MGSCEKMLPRSSSSAVSSRRMFLAASAALGAAAAISRIGGAKAAGAESDNRVTACVFSKHLQFLDYEEVGKTAKDMGFDGIDLTVRPRGHVLPERVEDDLPKAVQAIRNAGIEVPMITTAIQDAGDPQTEPILRTASKLGIRYYRMGGFEYGDATDPHARLAELKPRLRDLVQLNKQYDVCAGYHNHSGTGVGAPVWDVFELVKDFDPDHIGSNFDIGHATVEGGYGGWQINVRLMAPRIRMVAVKDFVWQKTRRGWRPGWCPIGDGMVDLTGFFRILREYGFAGPISMHFEYSPRGTNKQEALLAAMRKDLATTRKALDDSGLG